MSPPTSVSLLSAGIKAMSHHVLILLNYFLNEILILFYILILYVHVHARRYVVGPWK